MDKGEEGDGRDWDAKTVEDSTEFGEMVGWLEEELTPRFVKGSREV